MKTKKYNYPNMMFVNDNTLSKLKMFQIDLKIFLKIREGNNMIDREMLDLMLNNIPSDKNIIFVGIGTDRAIFDMVGCLSCSLLREKGYTVYGTIDKPIHALNVGEMMVDINEKHSNDIIIGIDSAIGKSIGECKFRLTPIRPGQGLGKDLEDVGICSIVGVVGENPFDGNMTAIRFNELYNICKNIVDTIEEYYRVRSVEKCIQIK